MAGMPTNKATVYKIGNVCFVLVFTYIALFVAVLLHLKCAVWSTTASGVDLTLALVGQPQNCHVEANIQQAVPTVIICGIRCYLLFRQRAPLQKITPSTASPRLESTCVTGAQILACVWMIVAICVNLPVALRAPICLDKPLPQWQNDLDERSWRYGIACKLHRVLVALSVLIA
jgi:hypothetical protein